MLILIITFALILFIVAVVAKGVINSHTKIYIDAMSIDDNEKHCTEKGLRLGYISYSGKPLDISNENLVKNTMILGQGGASQINYVKFLLLQQTARGGGWLFIDSKLDIDTRKQLTHIARCNDRSNDLYILDTSSTYDPELILKSILEDKMIYVSLSVINDDTDEENLRNIIITDLINAVEKVIQDPPKAQRSNNPFLAVIDGYQVEGAANLFEQSGVANLALVAVLQSLNDLSTKARSAITQNTSQKIFFKHEGIESAEISYADLSKQSDSHANKLKTHANKLTALDMGEVIAFTPSSAHYLRIPMIKFPIRSLIPPFNN